MCCWKLKNKKINQKVPSMDCQSLAYKIVGSIPSCFCCICSCTACQGTWQICLGTWIHTAGGAQRERERVSTCKRWIHVHELQWTGRPVMTSNNKIVFTLYAYTFTCLRLKLHCLDVWNSQQNSKKKMIAWDSRRIFIYQHYKHCWLLNTEVANLII